MTNRATTQDFVDLDEYTDEVRGWLSDLLLWGGKYQVQESKPGELSIYIYTRYARYSIVFKSRGRTYCGCIVSLRESRPGEDWTRGNDLPDGPLEEATWRHILNDIVAYELVEVGD